MKKDNNKTLIIREINSVELFYKPIISVIGGLLALT